MGYYNQYNCEPNTTFVITAYCAGDIGYSDKHFWAADDCLYLKTNNKYVYYFLLYKQNYIKNMVRNAAVPRLAREVIENLQISIISIEEQNNIINTLNKFEELINYLKQYLDFLEI